MNAKRMIMFVLLYSSWCAYAQVYDFYGPLQDLKNLSLSEPVTPNTSTIIPSKTHSAVLPSHTDSNNTIYGTMHNPCIAVAKNLYYSAMPVPESRPVIVSIPLQQLMVGRIALLTKLLECHKSYKRVCNSDYSKLLKTIIDDSDKYRALVKHYQDQISERIAFVMAKADTIAQSRQPQNALNSMLLKKEILGQLLESASKLKDMSNTILNNRAIQ